MEIMNLPNNDRFFQYCRSLRNSTEERKNEMCKCNHLFVKLREKRYCGALHSSDCLDIPSLLECVHCGLTNKYEDFERLDVEIEMEKGIYDSERHKYTMETIMFHKLYKDAFGRCGKSFDESKFKLISDEVIRTDHPRLLYDLAKSINPKGNNKELFNIMKELNEIETDLEKFKLNKVEECSDLLERYKESKLPKAKKLILEEPKSI